MADSSNPKPSSLDPELLRILEAAQSGMPSPLLDDDPLVDSSLFDENASLVPLAPSAALRPESPDFESPVPDEASDSSDFTSPDTPNEITALYQPVEPSQAATSPVAPSSPPVTPKASTDGLSSICPLGVEHVSVASFFGRRQPDAASGRPSERDEVFRAIRPHRRTVLATGALAGCSALMEIAVITIIASFAGRMLSEDTSIPIFSELSDGALIGVAVSAMAAKILIDLVYARKYSQALYAYESRLRRRIAELQANCAWATIEDSAAGSIHSLLWTSVHRSREGFAQAIGILTSLASLVLMLAATVVAARLMIIPVLVGLLLFGLAFRPLIRATRRTSHELREAYLGYGKELN